MKGNTLSVDRSAQFWILQLVGWSTWVIMLVARDRIFVPPEYILERAGVFILDALVGVGLTTALRYFYRYVWDMPVPVRAGAVLVGSLAAALLWQPIKYLITSTPFGSSVDLTGYGWVSLFSILPFSYLLILCWSILYFCIKYYQLLQAEREKSLRSAALAHQAQLRMLRYQLNPHFLFNTLNAISTLVLQQATVPANDMVTKLSKFLRYSLDHDPLDRVDLAEEITSARLYLDIEKVRFEDRMKIELNISAEAERALVPNLLLQPLIENSVKHALARSEDCGLIQISARVEDQQLLIEVADDGPGLSQDIKPSRKGSSGVDLRNVRERLIEFYGDEHEIVFCNRQPAGCSVKVRMPYETRAMTEPESAPVGEQAVSRKRSRTSTASTGESTT